MPPQGTPSYNRLLNLLHSKTVPEVREKISVVKRVLYEHDSSPAPSDDSSGSGSPVTSILDQMMHSLYEQKPMTQAMEMVQNNLPNGPKSNVLRLNCPFSHVGRADLHNIYPINKDRQFVLPDPLRKGLKFQVVKARNPISLLFAGSYYLVFPNYNQACVYYLESKGKLLNGFEVDLEFVYPSKNHLKYMGSPILHSKNINTIDDFAPLSEKVKHLDCAELFTDSANQLKILTELEKVKRDRSEFTNTYKDPLYDILEYFMDVPFRYSLVLVHNLPFGITKPSLNQLLWNYEFSTESNPHDSMGILHASPATQVSLALLRFKDETNAARFVRNYHGRAWNKMGKTNVKPLYEPIRCEIVD